MIEDPREKAELLFALQVLDSSETLLNLDVELSKKFPIPEDNDGEVLEHLNHVKAMKDKCISDYTEKYGDDFRIPSRHGEEESRKRLKDLLDQIKPITLQ